MKTFVMTMYSFLHMKNRVVACWNDGARARARDHRQ